MPTSTPADQFSAGPKGRRKVKAWQFGRGLLAIALVAISIKGLFPGRYDAGSSVASQPVDGSDIGPCYGYQLILDPNERGRLLSEGVKGSPSEVRNRILVAASHDPRVLHVYWNAALDQGFVRGKLVNNEQELVQGKCLSPRGQRLHQKLAAAFTLANARRGQAPTSGVNTGATQGAGAFQIAGTIGGNRTATVLTNVKGGKLFILHRCGNVVVERPIPRVPSRQPPPPEGMPEKDPSKSVNLNTEVPEQVRGPGAGGEPAAPGENENPSPVTGCQGACDGQGTEPSPPPPPPPAPGVNNPDDSGSFDEEANNNGDGGGW